MSYSPNVGYSYYSRYRSLSNTNVNLRCDPNDQEMRTQDNKNDESKTDKTRVTPAGKNIVPDKKTASGTVDKTAGSKVAQNSAQDDITIQADNKTNQPPARNLEEIDIHPIPGADGDKPLDDQDNSEDTLLLPANTLTKKWVKLSGQSIY